MKEMHNLMKPEQEMLPKEPRWRRNILISQSTTSEQALL
jgi:hypothetical protein